MKKNLTKTEAIELHRMTWANIFDALIAMRDDLDEDLSNLKEIYLRAIDVHSLKINALKDPQIVKKAEMQVTPLELYDNIPWMSCFLCEYKHQNPSLVDCYTCILVWPDRRCNTANGLFRTFADTYSAFCANAKRILAWNSTISKVDKSFDFRSTLDKAAKMAAQIRDLPERGE